MAMLTRKETEDIKPHLDKTVQKFLGFNEPSLVTTAMNCLSSGYDKNKTAKTLSSLLDETKALKLAERIFEIADNVRSATKSRKRPRDAPEVKPDDQPKKQKPAEEGQNAQAATVPGQLTAVQVNLLVWVVNKT